MKIKVDLLQLHTMAHIVKTHLTVWNFLGYAFLALTEQTFTPLEHARKTWGGQGIIILLNEREKSSSRG